VSRGDEGALVVASPGISRQDDAPELPPQGDRALAAHSVVFAAGAAPTPEALRAAHARLLREGGLQFSFNAPKPPSTQQLHLPHWLAVIVRALGKAFDAVGHLLGWVFLVGLALALAIVVFFIGRELIRTRWPHLMRRRRTSPPAGPALWRPTETAALALLEEADRLAAAGAYAEAVRLILHRSIEEIEGRRPRLVRPALTSREIARLNDLPEAARTTFSAIAAVVEASLFGGRPVDAASFAECRRTYEAFAFPGAWA
jgi:hypothetical protein